MKVLGGPKSRFFNKIVEIRVSRAYFLTICVIIFQHTCCIFIRYCALYIYINVFMKVHYIKYVVQNTSVVSCRLFYVTTGITYTAVNHTA